MTNFWTGRRVLVTGGSGFLGKPVARMLRDAGAVVFAPTHADYDLRDGRRVTWMLRGFLPQMVIHLAGRVGGIGANRDHPAEFFYDNLMMGVQLLHESYVAGVEKFVAVGTVCAYPKQTPVPFSEDDLWNGYPEETNAPYGLVKRMLLVQAQAYRRQYEFNSIFLLPANLYGPGDKAEESTSHVIPAVICRCAEAVRKGRHQIEMWGDGTPTREFLYVDDAARGVLLAAERYDGGEPVNLGSGQEISIAELVTMICSLTGFEGRVTWDAAKPNGQMRRCLNVERAKRFGFTAEMSFAVGLQRTVEHYMAQYRVAA